MPTPLNAAFPGILILGILAVLLLAVSVRAARRRALVRQSAAPMPPTTLRMQEDPDPRWAKEGQAALWAREIERIGFKRGSAWTLPDMPAIVLMAFFKPSEGQVAVLYHSAQGDWLDFTIRYDDGPELTVSNAVLGGALDARPDAEKVFVKTADVRKVHSEFKRLLRKGGKHARIDERSFPEAFRDSFRKDMEFRNRRGGVTREEIRRIADMSRTVHGNPGLDDAYAALKFKEILARQAECLEAFREKHDIPEDVWRERVPRLFILSETFEKGPFFDYLMDFLGTEIPGDARESIRSGLEDCRFPSHVLRRVVESLPEDKKPVRAGGVQDPFEADIYEIRT